MRTTEDTENEKVKSQKSKGKRKKGKGKREHEMWSADSPVCELPIRPWCHSEAAQPDEESPKIADNRLVLPRPSGERVGIRGAYWHHVVIPREGDSSLALGMTTRTPIRPPLFPDSETAARFASHVVRGVVTGYAGNERCPRNRRCLDTLWRVCNAEEGHKGYIGKNDHRRPGSQVVSAWVRKRRGAFGWGLPPGTCDLLYLFFSDGTSYEISANGTLNSVGRVGVGSPESQRDLSNTPDAIVIYDAELEDGEIRINVDAIRE